MVVLTESCFCFSFLFSDSIAGIYEAFFLSVNPMVGFCSMHHEHLRSLPRNLRYTFSV